MSKRAAAPTQEEPTFAPPPTVMPAPEPPVAQVAPDWAQTVPGEPAYPVKNPDGTWSAGGLVRFTLCVDESSQPRCVHCTPDFRCSGPPNEAMRTTMTRCVAFADRNPDRKL